tara:strand:- start:84 stop:761 length:678 start_codon:yes stop_codon:yes gene_type:complete
MANLLSTTIDGSITENKGTAPTTAYTGSGSSAKCTINGATFTADFDPTNHANNVRGTGYEVGDTMQSGYKPDNTNSAWIVTVATVDGSGGVLTATVEHNPSCTTHAAHAGTMNNIAMENIQTPGLVINLTTGNFFEVDLANVTKSVERITVKNAAASGISTFVLKLKQGSTYRGIKWPTFSNFKWEDSNSAVLTSTDNHLDMLSFTTYDNGTTWIGSVIGTYSGS